MASVTGCDLRSLQFAHGLGKQAGKVSSWGAGLGAGCSSHSVSCTQGVSQRSVSIARTELVKLPMGFNCPGGGPRKPCAHWGPHSGTSAGESWRHPATPCTHRSSWEGGRKGSGVLGPLKAPLQVSFCFHCASSQCIDRYLF